VAASPALEWEPELVARPSANQKENHDTGEEKEPLKVYFGKP